MKIYTKDTHIHFLAIFINCRRSGILSGQMMPSGQASLLNMEPTKEGKHKLLVIVWNRFSL